MDEKLRIALIKEGQTSGFEFKYTDTPKVTKSMMSAIETLDLKNLMVVIPGNASYRLSEQIKVLGLDQFMNR